MKIYILSGSGFLAILIGIFLLCPLQAQNKSSGSATSGYVKNVYGNSFKIRKAKDELRMCNPKIAQEKKRQYDEIERRQSGPAGKKSGRLSNMALGSNPREGQYRREMERLLKIEINNVRKAIKEVEKKHKDLIRIYPHLKNYQEIILEDVPGAFRDGSFVNVKKLIVMHYDNQGAINCVVLDSKIMNVYYTIHWTRRIIRLYYPNIQSMELETRKHNYQLTASLEMTSPEVQIKALRLVHNKLRTAIYSMDMMIARFYDQREKAFGWQIKF